MMKEYRFDPPSKMINVVEGATVKVNLFGNRVAYSAYGSVTSLNGEPEVGLLVEVQGQGNCSNLQEEATTEENGNFRIRGLQPTVNLFIYVIILIIWWALHNNLCNNFIVRLRLPFETECRK